jgi:catechol 2,3-dioxygenase
MQTESIHPAVRVGHVELRVADLDRATAFYRDSLGFNLVADGRRAGIDTMFLAAGDYHHHIALSAWASANPSPPSPPHAGPGHIAFVYPDRRELVHAIVRLLEAGHPVEHGIDHGASVSVYLTDPDGNVVELYYDRPRVDWFDSCGRPVIKADRFDPKDLLPDGSRESPAQGVA